MPDTQRGILAPPDAVAPDAVALDAVAPDPHHHQTLQVGLEELNRARATAAANQDTQLINRGLDNGDLHGRFTVAALIVNRTIASGIFTQPYNVVSGVGNPGASLLIWFVAGVIIHCITACWVELGLSIPRHLLSGVSVSTPRSGGDKNYLEYIFKKPDYLITCVFGITFIVFGNLAGNAIQLGIYMQSVLDPKCQDDCVKSGPVVAWAIGALTLCALFNVGTRKFSIYLNNTFAVLKISLIIVMIFIGVGYGSTHGNGCQQIVWENKGEGRPSVGNVITALFYAMYPYTGYEQPFYVLAEVEKPKTKFSQTVLWTMGFFIGLYTLINTSYLCMNPYTGNDGSRTNAAINFFYKLSSGNESGNERAKHATVQGVSFVVALFIFGNLLAQTYTASRVKQEIAKEGILPYSLWFAKSHDTLWALWCRRGHGQENTDAAVVADANAGPNRDREGEQAPFAATLLHLGFEVLLVLLVGLSLRPNTAYNFLTYIYTYVIVSLLGFLTVCGLAYLKYDAWRWPRPEVPGSASATPADGSASATPADGSASTTPADGSASTTPAEQKRKGRGWNSKWKPWLDPWPCVVAVVALGVLLFGAFAKPSRPSKDDDLQWWVKPLVGLLCLLAGVAWWVGLEAWQRMGHFRLVRRRTMHVDASDPDDNDPVLLAELVVIEKKKLAATQRQFGS